MVWWLRDGFALLLILSYSGCADSNTPSSKPDAAIDSREPAPSKADGAAPPAERPLDTAVKTGFSRCIEDWPTSGGARPLKASLEVEAPKLLWKTAVSGYTPGDVDQAGPVLSQNRLAFYADKWVYFLNKDGTKPETLYVEGCPSGLVADEQGNVYYTSDTAIVSLDASGKPRWQVATNGLAAGQLPSGPGEGCRPGLPPVLGPDGILYATTYDYVVRAIRTSDGKVLWSQPTQTTSRVMGGGGKAVFVAYGQRRTDALDTRDGSSLGSFINPAYGGSFTWPWGSWIQGWDLGIGVDLLYVYDTCGKDKAVRVSQPSRSGIIASGELVAMSSEPTSIGEWTRLSLHSFDGKVVSGPGPSEGQPIAAGADGAIYTYRSQRGTAPAINRLLAYSPELKELWRIELTAESSFGFNGNVVLDDDGVLYLSRPLKGSVTEILAVQTRSPGLADSSWPSFRHDNRGTAWLVPGTPADSSPPDAASNDAIDAPVDQPAGN